MGRIKLNAGRKLAECGRTPAGPNRGSLLRTPRLPILGPASVYHTITLVGSPNKAKFYGHIWAIRVKLGPPPGYISADGGQGKVPPLVVSLCGYQAAGRRLQVGSPGRCSAELQTKARERRAPAPTL